MSFSVRGMSEDGLVTANVLVDKLKRHDRTNRKRTRYYESKNMVRQVGGVIPPQYMNMALAMGWAAKPVDGLARRCNLERMFWTDGDLDSLGMQELEDSNFLYSELAQGRTDSLIHGVSYLITTKGIKDRGEPKALVQTKTALEGTGEWNARRRALDNFLSVTSWRDGRVDEFNLYLDGVTITVERGSRGLEVVDQSEHKFGVPVDPQVYRPRAGQRMGRSRITRAVMSLSDQALRAVVRMEAHMDVYAIKKLILLGAEKSVFGDDQWQHIMGRVLALPDDDEAENGRAEVREVSAESPAPHLSHLNALAKMMARESDLPDADFALADMAVPTSAESYSASRENLIAESEGAMGDWSPAIRRTVTRALAIQNDFDEIPREWASIKDKWRSPLYLSRAAEADAGAKQVAAAPEWLRETRTGLRLLGLSESDIDEAQAERRLNQGRLIVEAVANGRLAVEGGVGDGDRGGGVGVAGGVPAVEVN